VAVAAPVVEPDVVAFTSPAFWFAEADPAAPAVVLVVAPIVGASVAVEVDGVAMLPEAEAGALTLPVAPALAPGMLAPAVAPAAPVAAPPAAGAAIAVVPMAAKMAAEIIRVFMMGFLCLIGAERAFALFRVAL
jgi:hypothetical protein